MNTAHSDMNKQQAAAEISQWLDGDKQGYFITLNAFTKDRIQFEQGLSKTAHKLNDYCYGRAYQRREKRLKIIGGIENGKENGILHAHLAVICPEHTDRDFYAVNRFVRKKWYDLLGSKEYFGSMVDVQPIGHIDSRVSYFLKDTSYWLRNDNLNIVVV